MKIVLQERGIDTTCMNENDMRSTLNSFPDFSQQKCILEEYIEKRALFYPKYHCVIEWVWCHAKKHTQAYANGTITKLRTLVPEALKSCNIELISKFFNIQRRIQRQISRTASKIVQVTSKSAFFSHSTTCI